MTFYINKAEFFSTAHSSLAISKYLSSIRYFYEKNDKRSIPPIVVTDFSFALFNSVLRVFDNCDLGHYLNWCFDILVSYSDQPSIVAKINSSLKTRIYLCSTHILKSIIKKTKKITSDKIVRKSFVFSFSLLQNSTEISQIETVLFHIYTLFMSETFDEQVAVSLSFLKNEISRRDNNEFKINTLLNKDAEDENEKANIYIWNDDMNKAEIKKNSPFLKYYENIFQHFQKTVIHHHHKNKDENLFYCPDFFELIKKKNVFNATLDRSNDKTSEHSL